MPSKFNIRYIHYYVQEKKLRMRDNKIWFVKEMYTERGKYWKTKTLIHITYFVEKERPAYTVQTKRTLNSILCISIKICQFTDMMEMCTFWIYTVHVSTCEKKISSTTHLSLTRKKVTMRNGSIALPKACWFKSKTPSS